MKYLTDHIVKLVRRHEKEKRRMVTLTTICGISVFFVVYFLILPAIALEKETYCGMEAHEHSADCYEEVLVCDQEEHEHGGACFNEDGDLVCEKKEHRHDETCYEKVLSCGKDQHMHTRECYEKAVVSEDKAAAGDMQDSEGDRSEGQSPREDSQAAEPHKLTYQGSDSLTSA